MLYWLIESRDQLKEFYNKEYQEVFLEPIYSNDNYHPILNEIIALYIKPCNGDKGYMLCISHDDTFSLNNTFIDTILQTFTTIYVRDKKQLLYFYNVKNFVNIEIPLSYSHPTTNTHNFYYQKHESKPDLNKIIPIVKHYEKCELIWEQVKNYCVSGNEKYLDKASKVFYIVESNGIRIDPYLFNKYYDPHNEMYSIHYNTIYTHYNLNTMTGRPSNSFNNINFAALKKDDGGRKCFVPKNDYFVEYDITAYHPTLVAKMIGFDFGDELPYEYFSREANIDINDAKVEMIKQMYGGVYKKYEHIEFFKQMKQYLGEIWEIFENTGVFEIKEFNLIFRKDNLKDMNPPKLLSYIIQATETYYNVEMMWEMLKLLRNKQTQLILYTYDSFCFDVNKNEKEILVEIENIITNNNLKFKSKRGLNYDFDRN